MSVLRWRPSQPVTLTPKAHVALNLGRKSFPMMKTLFAVVLCSMATVVLTPGRATAQNEILAEMYGRGVHAYYAGDYSTAYDALTMAIDNGSIDPRVYYFRGLVSNATGRSEEAEADWREGAELEATGRLNVDVGRALARFQGTERLELERIRQQARLEALAEAAKRSQARYGEIQQAEARVLRRPPQPADPPAAPAPVAPLAEQPPAAAPSDPPVADTSDPFADDMATGEPALESDDSLKNAMEDPFAGEAAVPAGQVPPNDTENPFGGAAAAGDSSDPFGGGAGAGSDPFGAGADTSDPFGGASDAGGADPFGGGADAGADPFGGGASDAGADPFGGGAGGDAGSDPFGGGAGGDAGGDPFGGSDPFGS